VPATTFRDASHASVAKHRSMLPVGDLDSLPQACLHLCLFLPRGLLVNGLFLSPFCSLSTPRFSFFHRYEGFAQSVEHSTPLICMFSSLFLKTNRFPSNSSAYRFFIVRTVVLVAPLVFVLVGVVTLDLLLLETSEKGFSLFFLSLDTVLHLLISLIPLLIPPFS
jgi:hypothetical protein